MAALMLAELIRLRAWLEKADLPVPPLKTIPGVEAHNVELKRQQLLARTRGAAPDPNAVPELRYIAAHYGPPEIRELAKPHQLPGDPRGPQF